MDSAWNGTREKNIRCSQLQLFFIDTDYICPPPGEPRVINCTYAVSEMFTLPEFKYSKPDTKKIKIHAMDLKRVPIYFTYLNDLLSIRPYFFLLINFI